MEPIRVLADQLQRGERTASELIETSLERITDPAGEGSRAFIRVMADEARAQAAAVDQLRADGVPLAPFAGVPFALKDLCDVEGQVTTAGSVVLADDAPAAADATVVARVRQAGFIPVGRTNMTEFAYSGLGLNWHYDTPRAPWNRSEGHIPGGSSSGTAVAVADGMVPVGLGTDTGGSCRIPAAYCGIVGYKPTASRVPVDGITPLSFSLDSVGPMATTVDCCAIVDAVFAGEAVPAAVTPRHANLIRLAVLDDYVGAGLDPEVDRQFRRGLDRLADGGVHVERVPFPELHEIVGYYSGGGLAAAEAYAWHRELLARDGDRYDQRIRTRIEPGGVLPAATYVDALVGRRRLIALAAERLMGFDAWVMPTSPILPPPVASYEDDDPDHYSRTNLASLRNTSVGNFLDSCSISIPASDAGEAPVGFMLMANRGGDHELFRVAAAVEALLG
ncbi:MAG: amidase [Actinomycetota bacterium]